MATEVLNGQVPEMMSGGDVAPKKPPNKKLTVEKIYQKKSQLEHILLRPDTYIGSVEPVVETMWLYDEEQDAMVQKEISYVPGLYKIFDEILVNAADNKQRDPKMDCIKIEINPEKNIISIWNNGQGIPVVEHKDEKMFVPTMIFGHLLTSSNYNDEEEKVTGGRNGYGAKLCNIFSTMFIVETAAKEYKRSFKQVWGSNMSKTSEPRIKDHTGEDFTKITFSPDLSKFRMETLDKDIVALMSKRAFDVAASTRGVKVYLNGKRLPVKSFKDYVELYLKGKEDDQGNPLKCVYENVNPRWEVAVSLSEKGFQQVSFVNSIATTKGGRHVDHIAEHIVKQLIETLKKKNKGGLQIKPHQVKTHLWVFVNCLIVNPTFDSQTKETMTLQAKNFGSKCNLSDKFITNVTKSSIVEAVLTWAKSKAEKDLQKQCSSKKQNKLKGVPKLEDANDAGSRNSLDCTLILTEGDSAKTLVVSGLGVVGRDKYGVFPLRGKLLNVREATHKQIKENQEIGNVIKILGLQYKMKYESIDDLKTLRYGKLMIMTDQDQDGSHIKGLLINFIHHNWPSLLKLPFLEEFITPIVKATKGSTELSFYSLPEFEEWKASTNNWHTYKIKYYKGLGTSTSKEAKEYFSDMQRHRIKFKYGGPNDDHCINMAFSKKCAEQRKEWLTSWMEDTKRRRELGLPEQYLYEKDTKSVNYSDFVNKELVLFSNCDNERSIPSLVDGLKPGQRKVLFTCLKRADKREIKVAQLAGSVAEHSSYHHGEQSLMSTIVNLAQNFVGSNNINLLQPIGQFGTRLSGGKDSASPRYIFTLLSPLTSFIFHPHDMPLLKHNYDDSQKIEPVWYIPIIPMVLVNGADGIGTGWMTKIPNYNPREIVKNLKLMLDDQEPEPMVPWWKNFTGVVEPLVDKRYIIYGEIAVIGEDKLEITELPIGTWTQTYKESVLEPLLHGANEKTPPSITDYKEYNTDTTVKFVVTMNPEKRRAAEAEGLHKFFKLQTTVSLSSMCVFDENCCMRKFESVELIMKEFFKVRLAYYEKRKKYHEGMLQAESRRLSNQARFIIEKCDGTLVIENKKMKVMIEELKRNGYDPDPVAVWKMKQNKAEALMENEDAEGSQLDDGSDVGGGYNYLLAMALYTLTEEKKEDLLRKRDDKLTQLKILQTKSPAALWKEDLDVFLEQLDKVEAKEKEDELGVSSGKTTKVGKKFGGSKKKEMLTAAETKPSPQGRRVIPKIDVKLKEKFEKETLSKENKGKRARKEKLLIEEKDEFDMMDGNQKTLADRLGTSPEDIEKKMNAKRKEVKQRKPRKESSSRSPKKKGKGKNPWETDSEVEDEELSSEDDGVSRPPPRTTSRRTAAANIKFKYDSDDEEDDDEFELHDNSLENGGHVPVHDANLDTVKSKTLDISDTDSEFEMKNGSNKHPLSDSDDDFTSKRKPRPLKEVSSDAMFDSLISGSGTGEGIVKTAAAVLSSEEDAPPVPQKKQEALKKTTLFKSSTHESKPKKAPKKAAPKKRNVSDSDEDMFAVSKKKKSKKKVSSDEDDDEDDGYVPPPRSSASGRARKPVKYNFGDEDDDDDDDD
ncbi:DNA topoisomerase 2 [Cryptotermes secundus]|uniref:DNA topoisomerase 2 n=3 Tax=Cryptotermes secundus TaxID=105785 RepID=A0A2J7QSS2_9NEOP|nr:DNA topoisomerase 2 isoform X2 [Cryptotermes secundus]PNF31624.1 DNA topoisomerase 2 [Cryptotermes secundus]